MAEKKEISMLLACAICTQTVVVLKRHQQPIYQLTINKKKLPLITPSPHFGLSVHIFYLPRA